MEKKKRLFRIVLWVILSGVLSVVEFILDHIVGDFIVHYLSERNISLSNLFEWISKHSPLSSGILFFILLGFLLGIEIWRDHRNKSDKETSGNKNDDNSKSSLAYESQNIVIEPPVQPMSGPNVIRFTVINKNRKKLINCHAKIDVVGVYRNRAGGFTLSLHPANYMYPNNVLWKSKSRDGNVELMPGEPYYLDVIELWHAHFRFLFEGDSPVPNGTREPSSISDVDPVWLSHDYHQLTVKLFGEDINQESFEIKKEFALTFLVGGNQNVLFNSSGKPHIDNTKPDTICTMIVSLTVAHLEDRCFMVVRI